MKLQLDEIVEHPDADLVLRKLEHYFREVSLEAIRTGDELIVTGLGPSFRTMNPRDKTIVRATSQPAATVIHIEADFLASALMGDVAQDDIVRAKIGRVLESLKAELNIDAASHRTAFMVPTATAAPSSPIAETVPVVATIAQATPLAPVETEQSSPPAVDRAPDAAKTPSVEPELKPEQEPKSDEPVLAAPRRSAPVPSVAMMEAAPVRKKPSAALFLLPLLILLLVAAGYFLLHHRSSQELFAATPDAQTSSAPAVIKPAVPAPPPPSPEATPSPTAPAEMPKDIKAWVQMWAAAISTRDIPYQLSFYATPLNRYFLTPNVSREQLLKNKQAEVNDRKGVWTLRAEDVVVQKQTPTNAVVFLTKHITVELPSSTTREERIKAQLKLKKVDGEWKITSERTVG